MKELYSLRGLDVYQKNLYQVVLRGKGDEKFKEILDKEISLSPPLENLKIEQNEKFLIAKHSFDQWNLFYLEKKEHKEVLKMVSNFNSHEQILASDYSYGQVYFELKGDKKNYYLNKLTHFDLRLKKFPASTMAQTIIARIDCSIYHLNDKFIITCNSSLEEYFKERLLDAINL
tara:strand:+ start:1230 stop:1751 length:522 start_codon:yes stop_codon:yes gene_type:complete